MNQVKDIFEHPQRYRKFFVAAGAAMAVLVSVTADGDLNVQEVIAIVSAFLGALGVIQVPNSKGVNSNG